MKLIKFLWKKWLPVSQIIGNFVGQLIMTIFYLVIFLPLGLIMRLFSDPLRLRSGSPTLRLRSGQALMRRTNFENWEHPKQNLEEAKKQY